MDAFIPRTSIFSLASEPPSRPLSRASSTGTEVPGARRSLTREVEHIKKLITRAGLTSKTNDGSITATLFRLSGRQESVTQAHILQELDGLKRRIRAETRPAPKPAIEDDPETEVESEDDDTTDERDDELDAVRAELHRVRQQGEEWTEAAEERVDQLAEEKETLQRELSTCQQERDGSKSEMKALAEKQEVHESILSELRSAHAQHVSILEGRRSEAVEHERRAAQEALEGRDHRIRQLQENVTRLESSVDTMDRATNQAKKDTERQLEESEAKQKAAEQGHRTALRAQREQLQSDHDKRYLALHAAHSKALQKVQAQADETVAEKDKDFASQTQEHEGAISKLQSEHDATVSMLRAQHEQAWSDLGAQAEEATEQARAALVAERAQMKQEKAELLSAHEDALETQRKNYDGKQKALHDKHNAAMDQILELQAQHKSSQADASRQLEVLRDEHERTRAQLESASTAKLASVKQEHALELDRLQSDREIAIKTSVENSGSRSATLLAEADRRHERERVSLSQQVAALQEKVAITADEGSKAKETALTEQAASHTVAIKSVNAELARAREEHETALANISRKSREDSEAAQRSFDDARSLIAQEHAAQIADREATLQTSKKDADTKLQAALESARRHAAEKKTTHESELQQVKTAHREELVKAAQKSRNELAQLKAAQADELAKERKSRSGSVNAQQFKDAKIMSALQAQLDEANNNLSSLRQQLADEQSGSSANIATLQSELGKVRQEMTDEQSGSSMKLKTLHEELDTLRQRTTDEQSASSASMQTLQKEIGTLREQRTEEQSVASTRINALQKELDTLRQAQVDATSRESVHREEQAESSAKINTLHNELETLQQAQAEAISRESALREEQSAALTNNDRLQKEVGNLQQSQADAASRDSVLKEKHAAELQSLTESHTSTVDKLKAEHDAALQAALTNADSAKQTHETQVQSIVNEHAQKLRSLEDQHNTAIQDNMTKVTALTTEHQAQLQALRDEHATSSADMKAQHEATLEERLDRAENESQQFFDEFLKAHEVKRTSELAAHEQELATIQEEHEHTRDALTAEHASAISRIQKEHTTAFEELRSKLQAAQNANESAENTTKETIDTATALQAQLDAQTTEVEGVRKALRQLQAQLDRKLKELAEATEVIRLDEHKITTMEIELTNLRTEVSERGSTNDRANKTHMRAASAVERGNARYTSRGIQTSARIDVIGGSPRRSTHRRNISMPVDLSRGELKNNGSPVQSKRSSLVFGPELITAVTGSPLARGQQNAGERPTTPTSPVASINIDSPDAVGRRKTVHDYVQKTEPQLYEPGSIMTANEALLARMIREHVGDMQEARDSVAKEYQNRLEALMREKERLDRQVTMEQATEFVTERELVSKRYLAQEQQAAMNGPAKSADILEEEQRLVQKYNKRIAKRKSEIRLQHANDFHNLTQDYDRRLADLLFQKSELEGDLNFGQVDVKDESDSFRQPRSVKSKKSIDSIESKISRNTSSIPRPIPRMASFSEEKEVLQVSNAEGNISSEARAHPPVSQHALRRLRTVEGQSPSRRSSYNVDLDSPLQPLAPENPDTDYIGDVVEFEKQGRALRRQSGSPNIKADTGRVSSPRGDGRPASIRSERSKRHSSSVIYDRGS